MSRALLASILRPSSIRPPSLNSLHSLHSSQILSRTALATGVRHASTDPVPPKTIVLEKPDKFRPPSHPQRLNRRPPRQYPGPPLSEQEKQAQKTRRYPHMFPNEGTPLHWFLTNKWIHVWISLGTLSLLAIITLTQSFLLTSPFAHLVPPISSLPFHPVNYVSEWLSTIRLHMEYNSQKAAERRREGILDAQKRRLYRRAHGMEDLDAEEEQGIDVRGLVAWDDGLTNKERKGGGGRRERRTGRQVLEEGGQVGDPIAGSLVAGRAVDLAKERDGLGTGRAVMEGMKRAPEGSAEQAHAELKERFDEEEPAVGTRKRRVKRWFGIWE